MYDNMVQMRVTFSDQQTKFLQDIDKIACQSVDLPSNAPSHWAKALEDGSAYRPLHRDSNTDENSHYLKLSERFNAFDMFHNSLGREELKRGRYIALVQVTGIYIGAHGATGKLASLQMRLVQVMFDPLPDEKCMIEVPMIDASTSTDTVKKSGTKRSSKAPPDEDETPAKKARKSSPANESDAEVKKSRKVPLKRQNAIQKDDAPELKQLLVTDMPKVTVISKDDEEIL